VHLRVGREKALWAMYRSSMVDLVVQDGPLSSTVYTGPLSSTVYTGLLSSWCTRVWASLLLTERLTSGLSSHPKVNLWLSSHPKVNLSA